jgi:MFS family permease
MAKVDWGRYGRRPIALLAAVAFIDSVDRGILPGVLSLVEKDLHLSDFEAGALGSVFVVMSLVVALPSGYIADRRPRTKIIGVMLGVWGVISALNAMVVSFWQFFVVRGALGAGETINSPASQSLLADYYPSRLRGRAYAYVRIAPIAGMVVGLGLGGGVGSLLGWRWAFLIVGVPGSLLAMTVLRLPEPPRGDSDGTVTQNEGAGLRAAWADGVAVLRIPVLRSLMVGTAISTGATAGFGFWAAAFYERHTSLSTGTAAGVVGGVILVGAVAGTILGGTVTDRLKVKDPGAPMLVAGVSQFIGGALIATTFLHVPLWYRLPGQAISVTLIIAAFPALAAMTADVVPADVRGITFSVTGFLSGVASAISPLLIGAIADRFKFHVKGELKGNLADAFLIVSPLIVVGALVLLRGRQRLGSAGAEGLRRQVVDEHADRSAHDGEAHHEPTEAIAAATGDDPADHGQRSEDPR